MRRKLAGIFAAMVVLGAAGCGDDSSSGGSSGEGSAQGGSPRAVFIREADAICTELRRRTAGAIRTAEEQADGSLVEDSEAANAVIAELQRFRTAAAESLASLEVPDDLSARHERYVSGLRRSAELLPSIANGGASPELQRVETSRAKIGKAIGFKRCV